MSDNMDIKSAKDPTQFSREVGTKAARKLKAQRMSRRPSGPAWA